MSQFTEWVKKRQLKEEFGDMENPTDKFNFDTDNDDFADDQDQLESEVFKVVLRKYPEETMDFLNTIAQRGDHEIESMLRKIDKGRGPRMSKEPRHPSQDDEFVPSMADSGHSSGGGDE